MIGSLLLLLLFISVVLQLVLLGGEDATVQAMVLRRPWTTQPWCQSVTAPPWPFAYQKHRTQSIEWKGRVNPNDQDMRHTCAVAGVQSKCHRCGEITCGEPARSRCGFQLQGVDWHQLPRNIPTVTDVPWAVGGTHRYDYGGGSHVCMFVSGGGCVTPDLADYTHCTVRCWGTRSGRIGSVQHPERSGTSDIWRYSSTQSSSLGLTTSPQGRVTTLAGSGVRGYADGDAVTTARFNNPQDVAVDDTGMIYIADTDNHCIRTYDPVTQVVATLAGICGRQGYADGPAATASFSFPTGVSVVILGSPVVYVADSGNHRIRKIQDGVVSCFAGLCGNGVETARLATAQARPHAGLADGEALVSRFDTPMGVDVDAQGRVLVADTGNHVIRIISASGVTTTLAGSVAPSLDAAAPGCVSPCLRGVPGFRDGNLTYAQFRNPRDVAVDGAFNSVLVTDGHRVRRVTYDDEVADSGSSGVPSTRDGVTSARRVVTLAGHALPGNADGRGQEATFQSPSGIAVSRSDGRVYTASPVSCRVRRISTAANVARPITCATRLVQTLLPSGCSSYDPPVDELFLKGSPVAGNIFYNYAQRHVDDSLDGDTVPGRTIQDCTGSPPIDALETGELALARRWPMEDGGGVRADWKEDTQDGTTIKLQCPPGCVLEAAPSESSSMQVYGSLVYTDESAVCLAAIHAGVLDDATGGLIDVTLERGLRYYSNASMGVVREGSTRHGVTSQDMPPSPHDATARLFSVTAYSVTEMGVQTVAGAPSALLASACGYEDTQPPLAARFQSPRGLAVDASGASWRLLIADSGNHRIRALSATCAKVCENGGVCVSPETCSCVPGWSGDDCSLPVCTSGLCGPREVCVGPETCACTPGYTDAPACLTPLCVQTCEHGGSCSAPDTCACATGWVDANCTTPVCSQTCGNGGNCTAPDTCTCQGEDWAGTDCRVPVCNQVCQNGGACVAPHTCLCAAGWSGYDCGLPICAQGFFVAHPSEYVNALKRPLSLDGYTPCGLETWCHQTGELDCVNRLRDGASPEIVPDADGVRAADPAISSLLHLLTTLGLDTTINVTSVSCTLIEVGATALTHFQYLDEDLRVTPAFRFAPVTPYGWNASRAMPWRGIVQPELGALPPFTVTSDRQVALVARRHVVQGVYACAHGGSCVTPGVCTCAPGWVGFDCRTPVCTQGYYTPSQPTFLAADPPESVHERHPTSNPHYDDLVEVIGYDRVTLTPVVRGGTRYLPSQGGYACSIRSVTQWEHPGNDRIPPIAFEHPNYYSAYMDRERQADDWYYSDWVNMSWPPLYALSTPLLDDTREGWKRAGTWYRVPGSAWQKGKCLLEFNRTCSRSRAPLDLVTQQTGVLVTDTDVSYRPRVTFSAARADWSWPFLGLMGSMEADSDLDCVDEVVRGCYNNGTCVAPDTCRCVSGWTGTDCSTPVCNQVCLHGGNCTLPNRCTCERGWTGANCGIPLCAQECRNGGTCIAPDTCQCVQWPSTWRDGRVDGGQPVFQTPSGQAQLTGYTGYDCNTPVCVQAEHFVLNSLRNASTFRALRGHGKDGQLPCAQAPRCPQYDLEVVASDGHSFQSGCSVGNPFPNPQVVRTTARILANLRAYNDSFNVKRVSDEFLCGNLIWEQGDYLETGAGVGGSGRAVRVNYVNFSKPQDGSTWVAGGVTPGEGIYACYNHGSCVAPDTCSCGDGWSGFDCNTPLCRFLQRDGKTVTTGCQHDGVCVDKDTCRCITTESTLHVTHPDAPRGLTGYTGSDCAIPICVQGVFDPLCHLHTINNSSTVLGTGVGVDGCYRCLNGGACVGPDLCACADGWTGFDCSQPVCRLVRANVTQAMIRDELFTVDDRKVDAFVADPCGERGGRWGLEQVNGAWLGQGNCTLPSLCTCLCRQRYDPVVCEATGERCEKPWADPFHRSIPPGFVYGSKDCVDGFQGLEDAQGRFQSCHLQIYVPSFYRRYTVSMVALLSVLAVAVLIAWHYIRKKVRRRLLLAKAERRRSRKSSQGNIAATVAGKSGAFKHPKQA